MATTFYFLDDAGPSIGATINKLLSLSRGAAAASHVVNATAGGTSIIWTDTAGGTNLRWWSNPLQAVTIAGLVTANIRGLESALTVNSGVNVAVAKTNIGGTGAVNVVATAISTEWTASETAKSVTGTPASGVALLDGDRLRIDIQLRNVGTMAAGTATLFVGGPTSGASGDSFITFTETLLEYVVPPSRAYLQAVKRAAYW